MTRVFTIFTVVITCFLGCEDRATTIAVYDNHGGLAGPGLRITFYDSDKYKLESYTDIADEQSKPEVDTYVKKESAYVLTRPNGHLVYHAIEINGIEHLLDERTYEEYRQTNAKESLRRLMQRQR